MITVLKSRQNKNEDDRAQSLINSDGERVIRPDDLL